MAERSCRCCGDHFTIKRNKRQQYCGKKQCQLVRKKEWQRQKLREDQDYRLNARDSRKQWQERNPGYYRDYRLKHPKYKKRNQQLQQLRNHKRRYGSIPKDGIMIANMDAFEPHCRKLSGRFYLVPLIAKKDALRADFIDISVCCEELQKRTRSPLSPRRC